MPEKIKKKVLLVGGCGFIGHNLALELKKKGHLPFVVDSLAINNIYSIQDTDFENKKLYSLILNNRIELLKDNNISMKVLDARNYHLISNCYFPNSNNFFYGRISLGSDCTFFAA